MRVLLFWYSVDMQSAVMESTDIERPRYVVGHGITEGTSGFMKELEQYFELNAEGIARVVRRTLESRKAR